MEENELLKRAEELCRRSERSGKPTATAFLTPAEQMLLREKIHPDLGTQMCFYGGYEDSERNIAVFLSEEDVEEEPKEWGAGLIRAVHFKAFFGEPGHRDYLGALLASGIVRDRLGDILINGKNPAEVPVLTFDNGTATVNNEILEALGLTFEQVEELFAPYCTRVQAIDTAEEFE